MAWEAQKGIRGGGGWGIHHAISSTGTPQIFEELCARITTFPSGLSVAPPSSPNVNFRPPGRHSEHVLTSILDTGKVVPA